MDMVEEVCFATGEQRQLTNSSRCEAASPVTHS